MPLVVSGMNTRVGELGYLAIERSAGNCSRLFELVVGCWLTETVLDMAESGEIYAMMMLVVDMVGCERRLVG